MDEAGEADEGVFVVDGAEAEVVFVLMVEECLEEVLGFLFVFGAVADVAHDLGVALEEVDVGGVLVCDGAEGEAFCL